MLCNVTIYSQKYCQQTEEDAVKAAMEISKQQQNMELQKEEAFEQTLILHKGFVVKKINDDGMQLNRCKINYQFEN